MECLRCGKSMLHVSTEKLQLRKTRVPLSTLPSIVGGEMELNVYVCPVCGKVELFHPKEPTLVDMVPQEKCPRCGTGHDFEQTRCPHCGFSYMGV